MFECTMSIDVQPLLCIHNLCTNLPVSHFPPFPTPPLSLAYQWNNTVCTVKPTAILIRMSEIDIYIKLYIFNTSGFEWSLLVAWFLLPMGYLWINIHHRKNEKSGCECRIKMGLVFKCINKANVARYYSMVLYHSILYHSGIFLNIVAYYSYILIYNCIA